MSEMKGLYREQFEHDNCGIGAVVNSNGVRSHKTVENALAYCRKPGTPRRQGRRGKDRRRRGYPPAGIPQIFPAKWQKKKALISAEREITVSRMLFLPQDEMKRNQAKKMFEIIAGKEGLTLLRLP